MAKPIKMLELHYPMIQFLIIVDTTQECEHTEKKSGYNLVKRVPLTEWVAGSFCHP